MADSDISTVINGTADDDVSASADAEAAASTDPGEVSVLRSRYAGQTAKVNELTAERQRLIEEREQLRKELERAQKGTTSADEAAKALLAAKDEEIARIRREAELTRIQSRYPEVFGELGEAAAGLSEEKLAAMEARFRGASTSDEPPTPRGQNAARNEGSGDGGTKDVTSADIIASMRSMAVPPEWGG